MLGEVSLTLAIQCVKVDLLSTGTSASAALIVEVHTRGRFFDYSLLVVHHTQQDSVLKRRFSLLSLPVVAGADAGYSY